jgi:hypothetical protein
MDFRKRNAFRSSSPAHFRFWSKRLIGLINAILFGSHFQKRKANAGKEIAVIGASRYADVAAAIKLKIFRERKSETNIDSADPVGIVLRACGGKKFPVAIDLAMSS